MSCCVSRAKPANHQHQDDKQRRYFASEHCQYIWIACSSGPRWLHCFPFCFVCSVLAFFCSLSLSLSSSLCPSHHLFPFLHLCVYLITFSVNFLLSTCNSPSMPVFALASSSNNNVDTAYAVISTADNANIASIKLNGMSCAYGWREERENDPLVALHWQLPLFVYLFLYCSDCGYYTTCSSCLAGDPWYWYVNSLTRSPSVMWRQDARQHDISRVVALNFWAHFVFWFFVLVGGARVKTNVQRREIALLTSGWTLLLKPHHHLSAQVSVWCQWRWCM